MVNAGRFRRCLTLGSAFVLASVGLPPAVVAQPRLAPLPAAEVTPDPWPKSFNVGGTKYTLYQPQLKSWDGRSLQAFAAASVLPAGAPERESQRGAADGRGPGGDRADQHRRGPHHGDGRDTSPGGERRVQPQDRREDRRDPLDLRGPVGGRGPSGRPSFPLSEPADFGYHASLGRVGEPGHQPKPSQGRQNMMDRRQLVVGIVLASALALTGCAGKAHLSTSKMCMAHGGTYNAAAKSCTYQAKTQSAQQICQGQGGYYDTGADVCEVGME